MKRGLAPAGVILMGAAIALALLGVGYGLFSDTLRINGAVATGSVDAAFSLHEVDQGLVRGTTGGPADNGVNEDKEAGGLDIAECAVRPFTVATPISSTAAVDVADDVASARPSDFLYVYLKNAYPSFNCYADFDVHNVGAIPMKVNKPAVGPVPDPSILTVEFQNCYDSGVQVEPGKEVLCTLHVHVEGGAQRNTVYRFGATICAYQWNVETAIRCPIPVEVEPIPADLIDVQPMQPLPAPAAVRP